MTTSDISWLFEPHTQALFMRFPLPLAILGHDGNIKQLNDCFNKTFDRECLNSKNLQKILQEVEHSIYEPVPFQCDECGAEVFVRAINLGDNLILILEKSAGNTHNSELIALHRRVLELEKISVTDKLTGAWNRGYFDRIIPIELARSLRYRQPLSLIFFDIDHFKQINDTFGHAVGDTVLSELVRLTNANIRASDMLFRWGGEEFMILATSTRYHAAESLAEGLRSRISGHDIDGAGRITISLGVAEYVSEESEARWFKRADDALYAAKNSGRNRVVVDAQGNSDLWVDDSENSMVLHLNWHDSYDCGQPVIDAEHRKLFDLANVLMNMAFTRGEKPQEFHQALENLLAHVIKHFADEEAILAEHHYPDLIRHSSAHKHLVERALQLRDASLAGGVSVGEMVDFLADEVIAKHMLKTDRAFYPLFEK
ncbi:MAG: diguanylate cyclase [Methylovulum sp.]|nr:diguanylate cyclase [Methylovulum sp.]